MDWGAFLLDLLKIVGGLIVGIIIGFLIAKKIMKKQLFFFHIAHSIEHGNPSVCIGLVAKLYGSQMIVQFSSNRTRIAIL